MPPLLCALCSVSRALQWLASVGASMQMTGDIILTFTLIYVLRRSRTGVKGYVLRILVAPSPSPEFTDVEPGGGAFSLRA